MQPRLASNLNARITCVRLLTRFPLFWGFNPGLQEEAEYVERWQAGAQRAFFTFYTVQGMLMPTIKMGLPTLVNILKTVLQRQYQKTRLPGDLRIYHIDR